MALDGESLYALLPQVYRLRDSDRALHALVSLLGEQAEVLEEDVRRLYDDLFIETCAEWVVPYIGDLLGVTPLHTLADRPGSHELERLRSLLAPRAQVANTLPLRRRKGTAAALEQLATDVTGWRARAVELFRLVAISAHLDRPRPEASTLDVRRAVGSDLGTVFERALRSPELREMKGVARRHIPNVAIGLFRTRAGERARFPATAAPPSPRHFRLSPLGCDTVLFHREHPEPEMSHLAERLNVPGPIAPHAMAADLDAYYGPGRSLLLRVNGLDVVPAPGQTTADIIEVCDLADNAQPGFPAWGFDPGTRWRVDPRRGRLLAPGDRPPPARLEVSFHEGITAELGGGAYDRSESAQGTPSLVARSPADDLAALDRGIVEVAHPGLHTAIPVLQVAAGATLELRATDGVFAQLASAPLVVRGLGPGARFVLSGVRLQGWIRVEGTLAELVIRDCTFVPGRTVDAAGAPAAPGQPSLVVDTAPQTTVLIERTTSGAIQLGAEHTLNLDASTVDAGAPAAAALTGMAGRIAHLEMRACTVVGRIDVVERIGRIADSILWARSAGGLASVSIARRQEGHLCFSWVPLDASGPARHRCLPLAEEPFEPQFESLRYGDPAYLRLRRSGPCRVLLRAASDESEVGVYHDLYEPLREMNLRARLEEYLRVGFDADLVFVS